MSFIVFGNHVVRSLINSAYFSFKKIILREEYERDRELLDLLKKKKILYQLLAKGNFSRYNFAKKNQGIVAFINKYNYTSIDVFLKCKLKKKFPLIIMLDSIEDPHNFGAILRTCAAFSVDGIIITKKNQVPVNKTVIEVSTGGIAYVPVCQENNLGEVIEKLKTRGYKIIATVCDSQAKKYNKFEFNSPICLILGNEHKGIRFSLIKKASDKIYIPVSDKISSLNVSVSFGIICSKIISQWENK